MTTLEITVKFDRIGRYRPADIVLDVPAGLDPEALAGRIEDGVVDYAVQFIVSNEFNVDLVDGDSNGGRVLIGGGRFGGGTWQVTASKEDGTP